MKSSPTQSISRQGVDVVVDHWWSWWGGLAWAGWMGVLKNPASHERHRWWSCQLIEAGCLGHTPRLLHGSGVWLSSPVRLDGTVCSSVPSSFHCSPTHVDPTFSATPTFSVATLPVHRAIGSLALDVVWIHHQQSKFRPPQLRRILDNGPCHRLLDDGLLAGGGLLRIPRCCPQGWCGWARVLLLASRRVLYGCPRGWYGWVPWQLLVPWHPWPPHAQLVSHRPEVCFLLAAMANGAWTGKRRKNEYKHYNNNHKIISYIYTLLCEKHYPYPIYMEQGC